MSTHAHTYTMSPYKKASHKHTPLPPHTLPLTGAGVSNKYVSAVLVSVFLCWLVFCFATGACMPQIYTHTCARTHARTHAQHHHVRAYWCWSVHFSFFLCDECIFFLVCECGAVSVFFCAGVCMLRRHTRTHTNTATPAYLDALTQ